MKNLRVILVGSKYPRNIGLVSRILSNYSVDSLILIQPQCQLGLEARQGAAQGQKPLENARIYSSWQEFYDHEPEGLRVAFSRRQGRRRASEPLGQLLEDSLFDQCQQPIDFIFGAEDHGLKAEDLELVHRMAHFDLPGELQSMNLSHSVLVAVHTFYQSKGFSTPPTAQRVEPVKDPGPTLKLWLESLNFNLNDQPRWNALTMLKQLILRANPSQEELHKLEMIIQQTVRKLTR